MTTVASHVVSETVVVPDDRLAAAQAALARGDFQLALSICTGLPEPSGHDPRACLIAAFALQQLNRFDDAERLVAAGLDRHRESAGLWIERAFVATRRGAWQVASERWHDVQRRFPDQPLGYSGEAVVLRDVGRFDEARALLLTALGRFPADPGPAIEYAVTVEMEQGWPAAARAWEAVRLCHPDEPAGYTAGARALREIGRQTDADALIDQGVTRLPDHSALRVQHVHIAMRQKNWGEAILRSEIIRTKFPDLAEGYHLGGESLKLAGRMDEADLVLTQAIERFPSHIHCALQWADVAQMRHDEWSEVHRRWRLVQQQFAYHPITWSYFGAALREAGDFDQAEEILAAALARFPSDLSVSLEHAAVASRRGDWPEAKRRWDTVQQNFPSDPTVQYRAGQFRVQMQLHVLDSDSGDALPTVGRGPATADDRTLTDHELAMAFESLGDNCELGMIQRKCAAEPLGLLRWAAVPYEKLLTMLEVKFDGVGVPANTVLELDPNGEYHAGDTRYFRTHTFVHENDIARDLLYTRICRRLARLKEKLIDDLRAADKTFVYKQVGSSVTDDQAIALHRAIRRYGQGTLLCVRLADEIYPNGTVRVMHEGLFIGYIDQLPPDPPSATLDSWLPILRRTHLLRQRQVLDVSIRS
jgi:Flp pilus assembly protein TadD